MGEELREGGEGLMGCSHECSSREQLRGVGKGRREGGRD